MSGQFALVSTVDSMGPDFPSHCVMIFGSERDAVVYAAQCIVEHDEHATYIADEGNWVIGEDHWDNPADFLEAWQDGLDALEYFHVKPVVSSTSVGLAVMVLEDHDMLEEADSLRSKAASR